MYSLGFLKKSFGKHSKILQTPPPGLPTDSPNRNPQVPLLIVQVHKKFVWLRPAPYLYYFTDSEEFPKISLNCPS